MKLIRVGYEFTDIGDGIASLELKFLERFFIVFIAIKLDYGHIVMNAKFDEYFLPKPSVKRRIKCWTNSDHEDIKRVYL